MKIKGFIEKIRLSSKILTDETAALFLAYKRPDVLWYAKVLAIIVVGYALSPIDLIPDFIPVLGQLDDLILIPLGISIVIKLIPKDIMEECRIHSRELFINGKPKNYIAAVVLVCIWIIAIGATIRLLLLC